MLASITSTDSESDSTPHGNPIQIQAARKTLYPRLLERAVRAAAPPAPEPAGPTSPPTSAPSDEPPVSQPKPTPQPKATEFVPIGALPAKFAKPFLADESDVGDYVETLRETLLTAIRNGKRITL